MGTAIYADPAYTTPAADFRQQTVKFVRGDGLSAVYRLCSAFSIKPTNSFGHVQGSYNEPQAFTSGQYGVAEGSFELYYSAWLHFLGTFLNGHISELMFDIYVYTAENNLTSLEVVHGVRISDTSKDTTEGTDPIKVTANFKALQYRPNDMTIVAPGQELLELNVKMGGYEIV